MHHILYNFLKSDQQKNLTSSLPNPLLVPTVLAGRPSSQYPQGLRPISFPRFSVDPLSEPHAGAPAALVDELDATSSNARQSNSLRPDAKPEFYRFFLCALVLWPRAVWISFGLEHWRLGLLKIAFTQAHSGTAPILVDEFHTGSFQGAADCEVVRCSHRRLVIGQFGAADRGNAQRRSPRKLFSTPPNERASSSDLCAGQRP
jgi:hypothetical protein